MFVFFTGGRGSVLDRNRPVNILNFFFYIWCKVEIKSSDRHNPSPTDLSFKDKVFAVRVWESMVDVYTFVALLTVSAVCGVSTLYLYLTSTPPLPYRQANSVRDAATVKLTGYNRGHSRTRRHIKQTLACAVKPAES